MLGLKQNRRTSSTATERKWRRIIRRRSANEICKVIRMERGDGQHRGPNKICIASAEARNIMMKMNLLAYVVSQSVSQSFARRQSIKWERKNNWKRKLRPSNVTLLNTCWVRWHCVATQYARILQPKRSIISFSLLISSLLFSMCLNFKELLWPFLPFRTFIRSSLVFFSFPSSFIFAFFHQCDVRWAMCGGVSMCMRPLLACGKFSSVK